MMIKLKKAPFYFKAVLVAFILSAVAITSGAQSLKKTIAASREIVDATQINPTTIQLTFIDKHRLTIDFYGENIFRMFEDPKSATLRDPESKPEATILVKNPRKAVGKLTLVKNENQIIISSTKITIQIDKKTSLVKVVKNATKKQR